MMNDYADFGPLFVKLGKSATLNEEDHEALRTLPFMVGAASNGEYLVREGQRETSCCIIRTGFACRHKATADGERQIVSFHIPGDILDLQSLLVAKSDHNIQAISELTYIAVPSEDLRKIAAERPNIADALWRDTFADASVFREWVLNVGRRSARERVAHMLCEFLLRCEQAGVGTPETMMLPMTQTQIAEATGLTPVHVNRVLTGFAAEGLIARRARSLQVTDWARFQRTARFDGSYLCLAA